MIDPPQDTTPPDPDRQARIIARLTAEMAQMGAIVLAAEARARAAENQMAALADDIAAADRLRAERDALYASTSWRLTAPLRWVTIGLRRLARRVRRHLTSGTRP